MAETTVAAGESVDMRPFQLRRRSAAWRSCWVRAGFVAGGGLRAAGEGGAVVEGVGDALGKDVVEVGVDVGLDVEHVFGLEVGGAGEDVPEALVTVGGGPVEGDGVGVVVGDDAGVGGGDDAAGGVGDLGELVVGDVAGPLVGRGGDEWDGAQGAAALGLKGGGGGLDVGGGEGAGVGLDGGGFVGIAVFDGGLELVGERGGGGGGEGGGGAAERDATDGVVADVAGVVGVDDVLGGAAEGGEGGDEFSAALGLGDGEDRKTEDGGVVEGPAEGEGAGFGFALPLAGRTGVRMGVRVSPWRVARTSRVDVEGRA